MKTLTTTIFAFALALGVTSCKDEVQKAADCTKATENLTAANKALALSLSKEDCLVVNEAVTAYRSACDKLPDGQNTTNCDIYEIKDILK